MDNNMLHRRESIILTAIDVINEHGIQGLSIREVAKRQEIATASIFGHFKSKNDLILAVLEHFTQYDLAVAQANSSWELDSRESIVRYIDSFYTYYENYPAITAIDQSLDVLRCEPEFAEMIKTILKTRWGYLEQMIKRAQADGQISPDIDSECIADTILGSCRVICLKWRIESYSFPLKERVLYTLKVILDSITPK